VTGHAGGSIHDITVATLTVPLAILVASQLSRSTLSWVPTRHLHQLPGWLGTHVGQYTALVGPSLGCVLSGHRRLCAAGGSAHCDAAVADASGASNPVCPPASAHWTHRRLHRGTRWSVVCQHSRGTTQLHLSLSQRRLLHITSTPGPSLARGGVWAGGLVLTPSPVPHSWDATSCREAAPSSSRVQLTPWSTLRCCLLPLSHWSPQLLDVSAGCPLS
jgi:hypothetical protein